MIEPKTRAEKNALRMGRRSLSRWNSPWAFVLAFLTASSILALCSWVWHRRDAADFNHFLRMMFPVMWATTWLSAALLWHERRVFYRMIERMDNSQPTGARDGVPAAPGP